MKLLFGLFILLSLPANAQYSEGFYKTRDSLNTLYMEDHFKNDTLDRQINLRLEYYNEKKSQEIRSQRKKLTIYAIAFTILILIISLKQ